MPCYPHTIATTDTFDVTLVLQDCKAHKALPPPSPLPHVSILANINVSLLANSKVDMVNVFEGGGGEEVERSCVIIIFFVFSDFQIKMYHQNVVIIVPNTAMLIFLALYTLLPPSPLPPNLTPRRTLRGQSYTSANFYILMTTASEAVSGHVLAPGGPLEDPKGPWTSPGGQIWAQMPAVTPPG